MKNRKIVHICLCGVVSDGFTYQDNLLTKYHKKMGLDVTIITSQWIWDNNGKLKKAEQTNYFNSDGVKVVRLPLKGRDNFNKKIKIYYGLEESLDVEKPDIIFIHNVSFGNVKTIISYIKKYHISQVFVDNHSDFSNSGTNWLSKNVLHRIIWKYNAKKLEPYVSKFYGVLPARVNWLIDMYDLPEEKCNLLVMGADDEEVIKAEDGYIKKELRKKLNFRDDDFVIVTGGKIDIWKKQTLLLMNAVNKFDRKDIKLLLFGSVSDGLKDKFNKEYNKEKMQYIKWANSRQSYEYFSIADLVVFPGRHSVYWEQAAGQGKPIICKYWEGTTHIDLGGNVEFLYEDSVDEIYGKIKSLIDCSDKYKEMKTASEKGKKYFSYKNIAERSIKV